MASKKGRAWIRKDVERGAWFYDGEQDLGHGSAVRMAATVLAKDPLFGWIAYGGQLEKSRSNYLIIPRDGLRSRFWVVTDEERMGIEMERDGFKKESEVIFNPVKKTVDAKIENRTNDEHITRIYISSSGNWELKVDGKPQALKKSGYRLYADIRISNDTHIINLKKK
ncbi:MAG: DUF5695 domain-containing protein [Bacteroidales bacterium]|nr:DUF5695 domain-containing protein [Bacteroidales bacterium]